MVPYDTKLPTRLYVDSIPALVEPKPQWPKETPHLQEKYYGVQSITHHTKLLPYQYHFIYEPGSKTPCKYGSRHPQIHAYSDEITEAWGVENAKDIYVDRIIDDLLPKAVTIPMTQTEFLKDQILLDLKEDIVINKYCRNSLPQYKRVFDELTVVNNIIMRDNKIVISPSLHADVTGLAHEGHPG